MKCEECGGKNVKHAMWVDLNNKVVNESFGDWCTHGNNWCNDCNKETEIIYKTLVDLTESKN